MPSFAAKAVGEVASAHGPKAFNSLISTTGSIAKNAISTGVENSQVIAQRSIQLGNMIIENGTKIFSTAQETINLGTDMVRVGVNTSLGGVASARQNLVAQLGAKREQLLIFQNELNQQFTSTLEASQKMLQEFSRSGIAQQGKNVAYEAGKFSYETAVGVAGNMVDIPTKAGDASTIRDLTQGNYRAGVSGIIATLIATELQRNGIKKVDFPKTNTMNIFNNFCKRTAQFALPQKNDPNAVVSAALLAATATLLNQKTFEKSKAIPLTMSFENKKQSKKNNSVQGQLNKSSKDAEVKDNRNKFKP